MIVVTPSGWYDTFVSTGIAPGTAGRVWSVSTSSASMRARFQRISNTSASTHASKRTLPFSCERIAASSSRSSAIPAIASAIRRARSFAPRAAHAGKASFAAATASATSCVEADAASPTTAPGFPGSAIFSVSSVNRSVPPMNRPVRTPACVNVSDILHLSVCCLPDFGCRSTLPAPGGASPLCSAVVALVTVFGQFGCRGRRPTMPCTQSPG